MIQAQNLHYFIKKQAIIEGFSFNFEAGKVTFIIGPNAAGKSTLLKMLAGALSPCIGKVLWAKQPIQSLSKIKMAQQIVYLNQKPQCTFNLKVKEIVALGCFPYQAEAHNDKKQIDAALKLMGLSELAETSYYDLSGGQQQRVHMARALAQLNLDDFVGKFILLDEFSAHLDLKYQHEILQKLKTLSNEGLGVIIVSHDLNNALQFSDQLIVLDHGKVFCSGEPKAVLNPTVIQSVFGVKSELIYHNNHAYLLLQ